MKKLTLTLSLILVAVVTFANDEKFIAVMKKNIQAAYEAKDVSSMQEVVNSFQRIASAEKNRWEPLYYIAYGNIMMANMEQEGQKKDLYLDAAADAIKKSLLLAPQESELVALEGFSFMIRVTVDPQSRGMLYAPQAVQSFQKAIALNPNNPRALALLAQMQFGTAQFFGSPTTDACATNALAAEKISTFQSDNVLSPTWGKGMIESLKEKCK